MGWMEWKGRMCGIMGEIEGGDVPGEHIAPLPT